MDTAGVHGFETDEEYSYARCVNCATLLIRGRTETEEEFRRRVRIHGARHGDLAHAREALR